MSMTKEEFLESCREMARDVRDPDGELVQIRREFEEVYRDVVPHDAEMATLLQGVMTSIDRLTEYVVGRLES